MHFQKDWVIGCFKDFKYKLKRNNKIEEILDQ